MTITPEEQRKFKKTFCIFTKSLTLRQFSVSACANQATGFPVNESLTSNGLFKTVIGLLKATPSAITWCVVPFKNGKPWQVC